MFARILAPRTERVYAILRIPSANQGELSLVYAFLFLYMACKGAGIWSVDGGASGARVRGAPPAGPSGPRT